MLHKSTHFCKELRVCSIIYVVHLHMESSRCGMDHLDRYKCGTCTGILAWGGEGGCEISIVRLSLIETRSISRSQV